MQEKIIKYSIGFTQVSNEVILNPNLSLKAKGIYAYLFSKPDDWEFHSDIVCSEIKESYPVFRETLKELIQAGLIVRKQKNEGGKFGGITYEFINPATIIEDYVNDEIPHTEKSAYGKNATHNNTYNISNTDNIKKNNNNKLLLQKERLNEDVKLIVSKLKEILEKKKGREFVTRSWNDPVRKMLTIDKIPVKSVLKALQWYNLRFGGDYIPVIESGASLRQKYAKMEMAMDKEGYQTFEEWFADSI